jgi:hypothetical protein
MWRGIVSRTPKAALSLKARREARMTTLTMRYIEGDFVVTGPDVEPARFAGRPRTGAWHTTRAAHQRDRSDL